MTFVGKTRETISATRIISRIPLRPMVVAFSNSQAGRAASVIFEPDPGIELSYTEIDKPVVVQPNLLLNGIHGNVTIAPFKLIQLIEPHKMVVEVSRFAQFEAFDDVLRWYSAGLWAKHLLDSGFLENTTQSPVYLPLFIGNNPYLSEITANGIGLWLANLLSPENRVLGIIKGNPSTTDAPALRRLAAPYSRAF